MDTCCIAKSVRSEARTRLPRYHRVGDYPEIRVGRPRALILEALAQFHYLTASQLAAFAFSPRSISYVRAHLAELYQASYIERLYLPVTRPRGSPLAVYCLDRKGNTYLRRVGKAPKGRFRPSEEKQRGWVGLQHTLEVNDLLIICHRLDSRFAGFSVSQMLTERDLRRSPMRVEIKGRPVSLIPDGWVDLQLNGSGRMSLALELDRGTHERRAFQSKVLAYCQAAGGEYQRVFASTSLTVLFVATVGKARLSQLLAWTEAILRRAGSEAKADIFRLAAIEPARADPVGVFFEERWLRPFERKPQALLARPVGEAVRGREEGEGVK